MSIRTSLITAIVTLGFAATAWAQPSVAPAGPPPAYGPQQQPAYPPPPPAYGPQQQPAYPPPQPGHAPPPPAYAQPPAPEPEPAVPLGPPKWSFGFHVFQGDMIDENGTEAAVGGYGVFARYRVKPRWELEVNLGKLSAELAPGRIREFRPMGASLLWHLAQFGNMDLIVRGGLSRADETYRLNGADTLFKATELHGGASLEYALRHDIAIGAHLRGFTVVRDSETADAGLAASGSHVGLSAAYRF